MSDGKPQRWLILSHAFNMDGRASSQTITDKIPHLRAAGIEVVVLSGVSGLKDPIVEHHQLWPIGPAGLKFELRHVLRRRWGQAWSYRFWMTLASMFLLPAVVLEKLWRPVESSWSWSVSAYFKGRSLCRQQKFDLIYSTGGAFAAHLAGCALKRRTRIPWLAEVHDPFVTPGKLVESAQQRMQCAIEKLICDKADVAIWFTEQALASAKARHSQLGSRGKFLIPGIDNPFPMRVPPRSASSKLVLGHFGSLSTTRNLARAVEAFEYLGLHFPEILQDLELHVYGGPLDEISQSRIQASITRSHFQHFGRVEADPISGISGRQRILAKMRSVDVLLLVHGEEAICEEYIPSKLYEYLWMQRPILAQVHRNPQMARMLKALHHRVVETGVDLRDKDRYGVEIAENIKAYWVEWKNSSLPDSGIASPYTTELAVNALRVFVGEAVAASQPKC
jgi:glycosyltransferase involved in cell wall biosynthesis